MIELAPLKARLHLVDSAHDAELTRLIAVVSALVTEWVGPAAAETAPVKLGAEMLAARLWGRRNSPAGLESISEAGPVYVSRNDPDIAQLIGLGVHRRPVVS